MTSFIYSTRDIHGTQDTSDVVIAAGLNIGGPRNGDGVGEAPIITVASVVTGTNAVGELLTGTAPTVTGTPAPVVTHQWRRGGVVMSPAQTGATYTQVSADVGFAIDRLDTAVNAYGFDQADSNDITIPATTTSWTNGAGTNLASNPLNWSHGLPSASVDTVFDDAASPDECIIDGSEHFKTFDARDYTGNIHIASSDLAYFSVHGDVFLDAGMGTPGTIIIVFKDDAELDTGGFPSVGFEAKTSGKTLAIVSNLGLNVMQTASDHVVELAAGKVITASDATLADATPIEWNSSEDMTFGAGAKIVLNCTYGVSLSGTGALLCPIEVGAASSTVTFAGSGFSAQTYTQAGGTLNASGLFTTVGNFSKSAGSATSSNIAVGGNFSSTGGTLVAVTANVTGTAVASNTAISGSNFSAGTDLDATDNCTDNGSNDASVIFVAY